MNQNSITIDATTVTVDSGAGTRTTDVGEHLVTLKAAFVLEVYNNFTASTDFNVKIIDCILT